MVCKELDEYVISKLNLKIATSDIYVLVKYYFNYKLTRKTFQNYIGGVRRRYKNRIIKFSNADEEALIKMKASNQKLQDKNRIVNKLLRGQDRYSNSTSELLEEILNKLDKLKTFKVEKVRQDLKIKNKTAIIQLTDLHLGEEVTLEDTLGFNEYGVIIGSKRLWKYSRKIDYFLGDSVSEVIVAFTGDILNSDRRLDELLTNAANRSEVFIQALQILSGFLMDLARKYKITVLSVFGNESRMDQDMPFRSPTHNFDFLIYKFLSMYLSNCQDRIKFLDVERNYEKLYSIGGLNILFFHGYKYKPNMLDKIIAKYSKIGELINYVVTGHIHSINIDEDQARSGSIVGGNFYSTFGLHLLSRATQNIFVVEKEIVGDAVCKSSIYPITIDLQNVEGCDYYKFDKDVCKIG